MATLQTSTTCSVRCLVAQPWSTQQPTLIRSPAAHNGTVTESTPLTFSQKPSRLVCRAGTKPATVASPSQELSGDQLQQWLECRGILEALGLDQGSAETVLAKAFGWTARSYWRDEIVNVVPAPGEIAAVLLFLRETANFEDSHFKKYLPDFPHVLACNIEKRLKPNVAKLDREWRISGDSLRGVLLRNPLVLGYTLDCKGDCESECDYCWARF